MHVWVALCDPWLTCAIPELLRGKLLNIRCYTNVLFSVYLHSGLLPGPWKSLNFSPDFQGLESPWKETRSLKVLEFVFLIQWTSDSECNLILLLLFTDFLKQMLATTPVFMLVLESHTVRVKLSHVNWTCVDMLIKCCFGLMQFSLNIVNVVLESLWKVLEFDFYIWARTLVALPRPLKWSFMMMVTTFVPLWLGVLVVSPIPWAMEDSWCWPSSKAGWRFYTNPKKMPPAGWILWQLQHSQNKNEWSK